MKQSKTVLISGGNGYVGLHMAQYFRSHNYNIITSTRQGDGNLMMDFSNPYEVASLKHDGIDAMIHTVSPNEMILKTDPYQALSENAAGIHAALDFCVDNNIKDFIYLSSFHVFGTQEGRLIENTPAAPQNDYGLAHYTAEQTVRMFDHSDRVNAWVIRASNIFGVPANTRKFKRWNLIPFLFCQEAVKENRITLLTPGHQLRNFVGVSDVCKKVHWVLEHRPAERIFHAYGRETMSVLQYAQLVQQIALEVYQLPVQIIRPEGNDQVVEFEFNSQYKNPDLIPKDELVAFVKNMLFECLTQK